jgi:hypothetical protein
MNKIIKITDKTWLNINSSYNKGLYLESINMFKLNYKVSILEDININSLIKEFMRSEYKYDILNDIDLYKPNMEDKKNFFKNILGYIRNYNISLKELNIDNIDNIINTLISNLILDISINLNYDNILDSESRINISHSAYGMTSSNCYLSLIDCKIHNSYFKKITMYKEIKKIIQMLYYIVKIDTSGILTTCIYDMFEYYKFIENKKSINLYNNNGLIEQHKNINPQKLLKLLVLDTNNFLKHGKKLFKLSQVAQKELKELLL